MGKLEEEKQLSFKVPTWLWLKFKIYCLENHILMKDKLIELMNSLFDDEKKTGIKKESG